MSLQNWLALCLFGAASLNGCASTDLQDARAAREQLNLCKKEAVDTLGNSFELRFSKLDSYKPEAAEEFIPLEDPFIAHAALKGIEKDIITEPMDESLKAAFRNAVIQDARTYGYDSNRIALLSVKEAVELSTLLTARKLEYFGTGMLRDIYKNKMRLRGIKTRAEEEICLLEDEFLATQDMERKKFLETFIKSWKIIAEDCTKYIDYSENPEKIRREICSPLTYQYDYDPKVNRHFSAMRIYLEEPEIVCRHYSRVNAAIFNNVLRELAPAARNTYMGQYYNGNKSHIWNQVTTVRLNGRVTVLDIAFVDPTSADSWPCVMDAFNELHFEEGYSHLKDEVNKSEKSFGRKFTIVGLK